MNSQNSQHTGESQNAEASPVDPRSFKTFAAFYPFYLSQHSNQVCRRLHFIGSSLALLCLILLFLTGQGKYLFFGLLCGYGYAWAGHFLYEKNRPATFQRPLFSLMGDWVLYKDILTGKIPF